MVSGAPKGRLPKTMVEETRTGVSVVRRITTEAKTVEVTGYKLEPRGEVEGVEGALGFELVLGIAVYHLDKPSLEAAFRSVAGRMTDEVERLMPVVMS